MIKKRLLSFLGAAAITAALTFTVVSLSPSNGFTSGTMQEGLCYEATGVAPDAIVASLNGNGASADLVAYWIGYDVSYLNSYMQYYTGSSINWDDTLSDGMSVSDYVKASVLSSVKQHLVLENLASKYGVTLTAEQEAAMAESDQSYIDQYGSEEAFEAEIAKLGMRRETYDRVARSNYLYQNLYELYNTEGSALYASDEDLAVYAAEQGYITADHILLATKDMTTSEALTDEQKAEKKALAEELVEKLNSYTGDDIASYFAELADQYSEDPGRESHPTGYTFTTGSMVQEFEDAAYALSEGEVSEIVEPASAITSCSACRSTRPQPPMRCATSISRTSSPSSWTPPSSPRARTTISLIRRRSTRRSSPRRRRVKSQHGALYGVCAREGHEGQPERAASFLRLGRGAAFFPAPCRGQNKKETSFEVSFYFQGLAVL